MNREREIDNKKGIKVKYLKQYFLNIYKNVANTYKISLLFFCLILCAGPISWWVNFHLNKVIYLNLIYFIFFSFILFYFLLTTYLVRLTGIFIVTLKRVSKRNIHHHHHYYHLIITIVVVTDIVYYLQKFIFLSLLWCICCTYQSVSKQITLRY